MIQNKKTAKRKHCTAIVSFFPRVFFPPVYTPHTLMPQGILAKSKAKKHSTRHQPRLFTGEEPARGLGQARRLSNARGSGRVGPEIIEISWVGSGDEVVKNLTGRVSSRDLIGRVGSGLGHKVIKISRVGADHFVLLLPARKNKIPPVRSSVFHLFWLGPKNATKTIKTCGLVHRPV